MSVKILLAGFWSANEVVFCLLSYCESKLEPIQLILLGFYRKLKRWLWVLFVVFDILVSVGACYVDRSVSLL